MAKFSNLGTQLFCLLFVVIGLGGVGVGISMMIKKPAVGTLAGDGRRHSIGGNEISYKRQG
jgi:hypothetical protein